MLLQDRIAILRNYELQCYRIAYYFLEDTDQASKAASAALLELGRENLFLEGTETVRMQRVSIITTKKSLEEFFKAKECCGSSKEQWIQS